MPGIKRNSMGIKWLIGSILLLLALSANQVAAAATYNFVFGQAYAQAGGLTSSTDEAYTGDGAWYELYPSGKTDVYIDPAASFGTTFTVDEIQSVAYHTLNDASNPSDVDFYLVFYTDPTDPVIDL